MTSSQEDDFVVAPSPTKKGEEDNPVKLDDLKLPLKTDRLFLYRKIKAQVAARVLRIRQLPDTRRTSFFAAKKEEAGTSWITQLGCRDRQMKYLKYELMTMVSSCLMLEVEDLQDSSLSSTEQVKEPIKCITMLLSNILFLSKGNYDARLRSVVKSVCVELLEEVYAEQPDIQTAGSRNWYFLKKQDIPKEGDFDGEDMEVQQTLYEPHMSKRKQATLRFEHVEKCIAEDIFRSLVETSEEESPPTITGKGRTKRFVIRTLAVGSVGLVVGGIFAITGGLAAPALVAAISAFGIGTGSAAFATLTTTTALAAMFGVTGGGMAAYKMKKRTEMLTEWKIRKENKTGNAEEVQIQGLHATVAVTGWLLEKLDFQRAWGIMPTDPPNQDKMDLLQRFLAVHGPEKIHFCHALLKIDTTKENGKSMNKKEKENAKITKEKHLWEGLERRYGCDPSHLLPFDTMGEEPVVTLEVERTIAVSLKEYVLPHGNRLGEVFESNSMLSKMEAMNDEFFVGGDENDDIWLKQHAPELLDRKDNGKSDECTESDELLAMTEVVDEQHKKDVVSTKIVQLELIEDIAMLEAMNAPLAYSPTREPSRSGNSGLNDRSVSIADHETTHEQAIKVQVEPNDGPKASSKKLQFACNDENVAEVLITNKEQFNYENSPRLVDKEKQNDFLDDQQPEVVTIDPSDFVDNKLTHDVKLDETREPLTLVTATRVLVEPTKISSDESNRIETDEVGASEPARTDVGTFEGRPTESDLTVTEKIPDATPVYLKTVSPLSTNETFEVDGKVIIPRAQISEDQGEEKKDDRDFKHRVTSQSDVTASISEKLVPDEIDDSSTHTKSSKESEESIDSREEFAKKDFDVIVWDWQASFGGELYTITWETDLLSRLCRVVNLMFLEIGNQVSKELAKQTIIGGVVAAVHIPSAIATCLNVIDDPYQLISFRADYAGIELANCLLNSEERRPVSLIGYSFGARVIFSCLQELARHQLVWEEQQRQAAIEKDSEKMAEEEPPKKGSQRMKTAATEQASNTEEAGDFDAEKDIEKADEIETKRIGWRIKKRVSEIASKKEKEEVMEYTREPSSIIEDVCFIGMPRLVDASEWCTCREIVGGRVINCYSQSDFFLTYLFQIRTWKGVSRVTAGTHPIQGVAGVENFDVTSYVSTHGRYPLVVPQILHEVGFGQPSEI